MARITVDGKIIEAQEGASVLQACLQNGIYIPHLCHLEGVGDPPASCRLCFVEINGKKKPVASCNTPVVEGLEIWTDGEAVRRLQRTGLRLLLSVHKVECKVCPSNRKCPLQDMARFLGVRLKPRRFQHIHRPRPRLADSGLFDYRPDRCVLCGQCIRVCEERNRLPLLTFAMRGFDTVVASFPREDLAAGMDCRLCLACVDTCPVSALSFRPDRKDVPR